MEKHRLTQEQRKVVRRIEGRFTHEMKGSIMKCSTDFDFREPCIDMGDDYHFLVDLEWNRFKKTYVYRCLRKNWEGYLSVQYRNNNLNK